MLIFCLILISTSLFGVLSGETEEDIAVATKEVALNLIYKEYWSNVRQGIKDNRLNSSKAKFKLIPITELQLWAAFHERFTAIRVNVLCWTCALFYTVGTATPDVEKAGKCEKQAIALSWYNNNFSAKPFLKVYAPKPDNHIRQITTELDTALTDLRKINKVFISAQSNYNSIFAMLKKAKGMYAGGYEWSGEPIEEKQSDYVEEAQIRLWSMIQNDILLLSNRISVLLQSSKSYIDHSDFVIPFEEVTHLWNVIIEAAPFEERYSDVEKILTLEEQIFRLGFEYEEIQFSAEWEITSAGFEGVLGYKLQQRENSDDDETEQGVETES